MKYQVDWIGLGKKLTKFMSMAISIPVTFVFIARLFASGFNLEKTFEHVALWQLPLFFLGIFAFSAVFGFLIAAAFRFASIRIENENLIGRNYWFLTNSIPLSEIKELYPFSNNGIEAVVASAGKHGKVYISTHTENLEDLIEFIESKMESAGNA
ncbi:MULTISPECIES: hypothetical protein [unclassified Microbulbifer]|uniref:hypothetical protein n=1 Tax=unclassified Microbulbifer TaxID=2619833 RepID=UPI001E5CFEC9|nr:hypothetical protein [Microbulbifer sp. YPW16]UHQ54974.1 hypothetical protein LVE68_15920 [Microbulbifer sp. YPW16]